MSHSYIINISYLGYAVSIKQAGVYDRKTGQTAHMMILSNNILYTDFLSILAARGDRTLKECINT